MNSKAINFTLSELRSLAFCAAVRHVMHHRRLTENQAIQLIADHCWVAVATVKSWEKRGVPECHIDKMLELLNSCSPWSRYQLAPRYREARIWLRVEAKKLAEVA